MAKKIKSFTIDEDAYNDMVRMFKQYDVDVSVSLYVDGCIKALISELKKLEAVYKGVKPKPEVPFLYIINSLVFRRGLRQKEYEISDDEVDSLMYNVLSWDEEYKAEKRGYTKFMYQILQSGSKLSKDKKYVLNKKSGKTEFDVVVTKEGLMDAVRQGSAKKVTGV